MKVTFNIYFSFITFFILLINSQLHTLLFKQFLNIISIHIWNISYVFGCFL